MAFSDLAFHENNKKITEEYNTYSSHNGSHYSRILKTFESPSNTKFVGDVISNGGREVDLSLLKKFPLRFYLPTDAASKKASKSNGATDDPRIKHLIIMINGLDEYKEKYLKQYDVLGSLLAEKNIASVLLSTPMHLHRTIRHTVNKEIDDEPIKLILRPSKVILDSRDNIFSLYDTTHKDIAELINCVKGNPSPENNNDFDFYKTHFSNETEISILGYSLGGLIAFGCYLQNHEKFEKCILFNTPGNLKLAVTKDMKINPDKWTNYWSDFLEKEDEIEQGMTDTNIDLTNMKIFIGLITNQNFWQIRQPIKAKPTHILQIVCGDDSIIDMKPWSTYFDKKNDAGLETKIVSQHIFAGIGHLPIFETRGSELMPNIARLIIDHVLSEENQSHWQEINIETILKELLYKISKTAFYNELIAKIDSPGYEKSFKEEYLNKIIDCFQNDNDKSLFKKFYHLYHLYNPKFFDLLEDIKQSS